MDIFAIADLHLSVGVPDKNMDKFGSTWNNYMERMAESWDRIVAQHDLVLLPGDISWALKLEEASKDLEWIDARPGVKVMVRGNHDYWWGSASKVRSVLPPSVHIISNDAFNTEGISIAGARFWDSPEFDFLSCYENPYTPPPLDEKIYKRELNRLELSLQKLDQSAKIRIVMTHYPPIGPDLKPSAVSLLLEQYNVQYCLFGHLHNLRAPPPTFGKKNGVNYILCAADSLHFTPIKIVFGC